jgi:hypothetical protein
MSWRSLRTNFTRRTTGVLDQRIWATRADVMARAAIADKAALPSVKTMGIRFGSQVRFMV